MPGEFVSVHKVTKRRGGVQQQNQKCIVVAGEFCMSTEE